MSVDSKMTAIAGQTRILSGTTAEKGLDDIASDLQAANGEVSLQADLLDQARALLSSKVAGGDGSVGALPAGVSALAAGIFVPPADATTNSAAGYAIEHGMGKTPNFYMVAIKGGISTTDHVGFMVGAFLLKAALSATDTIGVVTYVSSNGTASSYATNFYGAADYLFTDTTFAIGLTACKIKGGATYAWVCGILDGVQ